jgi:hypothetical protein
MALLGKMQPTSKFGEVFQYSNLMATAAGYIGGQPVYPDMELGAAYDLAMQKMIFDPMLLGPFGKLNWPKTGKGSSSLPIRHRSPLWQSDTPARNSATLQC